MVVIDLAQSVGHVVAGRLAVHSPCVINSGRVVWIAATAFYWNPTAADIEPHRFTV